MLESIECMEFDNLTKKVEENRAFFLERSVKLQEISFHIYRGILLLYNLRI